MRDSFDNLFNKLCPSVCFYDNTKDLYRAVVAKVKKEIMLDILSRKGQFKLDTSEEFIFVTHKTAHLVFEVIKETMPSLIDVEVLRTIIRPLNGDDEQRLQAKFRYRLNPNAIDHCKFLRANWRGNNAIISFYRAEKCGYYRGEDSGAYYSEYDEVLIMSFIISNIEGQYDGTSIRELITSLTTDGAEWPPLWRHKSLINYLKEHMEYATPENLYWFDSDTPIIR